MWKLIRARSFVNRRRKFREKMERGGREEAGGVGS
jgi:hypothetical protein